MSERRPFALSTAEREALDMAYAEFLKWDIAPGSVTFEGAPHKPPRLMNPKVLAEVRAAARAFHNALQPFFDGPAELATLHRLTLRMQEANFFQKPMAAYGDDVMAAWWTATLIDKACDQEARRGAKIDPRATDWICRAAEAWETAGGKPSAKASSRFARALDAYRQPHLPHTGGPAKVEKALITWRAWRASKGVALHPAIQDSSD